MIDAADAQGDEDPAAFDERSMGRLWVLAGQGHFSHTYSFATVEDVRYFLITLDEGSYLDFSPIKAVCDGAHDQLGPSLLTHLQGCTPLTPAFTPEVCRDWIANLHWEGWDEAENLLDMARHDLAYARGVDEALLSDEEVAIYADDHYFTPRRVDRLVERRYGEPGRLSLEACTELCRRHGFAHLLSVCVLLEALRGLGQELPTCSERFYETTEGYQPFGLVVGMPHENAEMNLVEEMYREHEQLVWQGGEFDPVYALEIRPDDPDSLGTLKSALAVAKRSLELTQELYQTLEVTRCLFP